MGSLEKRIAALARATGPSPFNEVKQVCDHFFGAPRVHGSHMIYKTPWRGDPRVNIQNRIGTVYLYLVKQVLKALERLEADDGQA